MEPPTQEHGGKELPHPTLAYCPLKSHVLQGCAVGFSWGCLLGAAGPGSAPVGCPSQALSVILERH